MVQVQLDEPEAANLSVEKEKEQQLEDKEEQEVEMDMDNPQGKEKVTTDVGLQPLEEEDNSPVTQQGQYLVPRFSSPVDDILSSPRPESVVAQIGQQLMPLTGSSGVLTFSTPQELGKKILVPSPEKKRPMDLCLTQRWSSECKWNAEVEEKTPSFDDGIPFGTQRRQK